MLLDKYTVFYGLYLITAALGCFYHEVFYAYHLLDLVVMSTALQNVVRAVTKPKQTLILTTIMGMFVIYFFTLILFFFMPGESYDPAMHVDHCDTMVRCFFTVLHRGLLMGGGVGDYLTTELSYSPSYVSVVDFSKRTAYDLAFFVIVLVLLLNIIFGIIIDTFSELRSSSNEKENLKKNNCFICNKDRHVFESHYMQKGISNGFSKHITEEHNMWNYLYFLIYLRKKDPTECTGAETYILECLQNEDLSWIPQGLALSLQDDESKSQDGDGVERIGIMEEEGFIFKNLREEVTEIRKELHELVCAMKSLQHTPSN